MLLPLTAAYDKAQRALTVGRVHPPRLFVQFHGSSHSQDKGGLVLAIDWVLVVGANACLCEQIFWVAL